MKLQTCVIFHPFAQEQLQAQRSASVVDLALDRSNPIQTRDSFSIVAHEFLVKLDDQVHYM